MFLIHVPEVNSRVNYIFDLIFKDILKVGYSFTTSQEEFLEYKSPKFSYGKEAVGDEIFFYSTNLLFEKNIYKQFIEFKKWEKLPVFFNVNTGELPFDIFAASFYLVSRYEEYLPHSRDSHNRFRAEESAAFKGGFLERPIINLWSMSLKSLFKKRYPDIEFPFPSFSFTPTIDIDNAFAYKHKGFLRSGGSLLEKLFSFEFKKFINRVSVHTGYKQDPYDSYEKQHRIHKLYNIKPLYFILLGDYGRYDKNLSYSNKYFIMLIKSLREKGHIGLHPSYNSNKSEVQLQKEKRRMESILEEEVVKSRQHYVKVQLPQTYRNLIKSGIREDYSMGYPSRVGFRAGISVPFYFYDLESEKQTELKAFPFVVMDTTLKHYLRFRSTEVVAFLKPIVDEIKSVGGNFIFIFHNESIGNERNWKNWGEVYEKVIRLAISDNQVS